MDINQLSLFLWFLLICGLIVTALGDSLNQGSIVYSQEQLLTIPYSANPRRVTRDPSRAKGVEAKV